MDSSVEIWKSGDRQAIWEHFCGYLDLDLAEFMGIQRRKLLEQISVLAECQLGRTIMGEPAPSTVEEFQERVPLTSWRDYEAWMGERREDILPAKPAAWAHTTGAGGKQKWVPLSEEANRYLVRNAFLAVILASASSRGEFSLEEGDVYFYSLAPPPYFSGYIAEIIAEEYGLRIVPPLEEVMALETLRERTARGFQMALSTGIQVITGLPSVLVKIGKEFGERIGSQGPLEHPHIPQRLARALERSRREGRPLLPRDLWQLKGLVAAAKDLDAFRDQIIYYWGIEPFEVYASTECGGFVTTSTWTRRGLTFLPRSAFLEFIPEQESAASLSNPEMVPSTRLLDELQVGESYELVFTNFNSGPFIRYRPGTMIKVLALEDKEAGVNLPQIAIEGRADKVIDLAGFTNLDEETIYEALEDVGVEYDGWLARKELEGGQLVLRLYLAPRQQQNLEELKELLHQSVKKFDPSYTDLEEMLGQRPLRLTLLPFGVFTRYTQERLAAGADPAQVTSQVMQPFEATVERILSLAREIAPQLIQEDKDG